MRRIIFLSVFLILSLSHAQEPSEFLLMGTWNLETLFIEGTSIEIPNNSELYNVTLDFNNEVPYLFTLNACQTLSGEITYPSFETMLFPEPLEITNLKCTIAQNIEFQNLLFDFFQDFINQEFTYFTFVIDPDPPHYYVVIYKPNGDYVEFNEVPNILLSVDEKNLSKFSLYPNPASTQITIKVEQNNILEKLSIYSSLGQLIKTSVSTTIDTSTLSKGVYFVEIMTNKGKSSQKLIIE